MWLCPQIVVLILVAPQHSVGLPAACLTISHDANIVTGKYIIWSAQQQ